MIFILLLAKLSEMHVAFIFRVKAQFSQWYQDYGPLGCGIMDYGTWIQTFGSKTMVLICQNRHLLSPHLVSHIL
jgi:hypothetical protein